MKQPWDLVRLSSTKDDFVSLPVTGHSGSTIPTSGDLHLYAVPDSDATRSSHLLLYADCEGFNGGEQEPFANKVKRSVLAKLMRRIHTTTTESLSWATDILPFFKATQVFPLSFQSTREEAVKSLFPRLLYNFSDVVVYVMPWAASRTLEHAIVNLLEWAQNSQKTAVNRVILPHMIVVLNVDMSDQDEWDTVATTEAILYENQEALEDNPAIKTYCGMLNQVHSRPIETIPELLKCCYSSVRFIRVPPAEKQYKFSRQVQILNSLIHDAADQARETKAEARCLLRPKIQDDMFRLAFEHYKNNLDKPFDFLESLLAAEPLDDSLSATLSTLLREALKAYCSKCGELSGSKFSSIITPAICSTITLHSYRLRGRHIGQLRNIYNGSTLNSRFGEEKKGAVTYQSQFSAAITNLLEKYCPCDFDCNGKRCVNSRQAHRASMHQDATGAQYYGTFESKFVDEWTKCWDEVIDDCFEELEEHLKDPSIAGESKELMVVWAVHCQKVQDLYAELPQLDITKMNTCSWCFFGLSLESLECGHRICWACAQLKNGIQALLSNEDKTVVTVGSCDHHYPGSFRFKNPIYIRKE